MRCTLLLALAAVSSAATRETQWTFEASPDGVWPALVMEVAMPHQRMEAFVFPTLHWATALLTVEGGGNWDPDSSSNAIEVSDPIGNAQGMLGQNVYGEARWFSDSVFVRDQSMSSELADNGVNMSMIAADTWELPLNNGSRYAQTTGRLLLGSNFVYTPNGPQYQMGYVQKLKELGEISSSFFGLHIGSQSLSQPPSLLLGGYEQNRALGDLAVFDMEEGAGAIRAFLIDMIIGVEKGGSPFNNSEIGENNALSVWQDPDMSWQGLGGANGSAGVILDPAIPYMYLPSGTCSAIAEHLPVRWEKSNGYYIWNTEDPSFELIVNSPAYLGFVFSDRELNTVTIKVPLKLLNLTLDSPIVEYPLQYFPCQDIDPSASESSQRWWGLGRAFLQAAFLGFNPERNLTYLAQAPGPDLEQSIRRTHEVDDETIRTNPAESFQKTWESTWTVLDITEKENQEGDSGASGENNLEASAISGIVVGSVASLWLIAMVAFFVWRRRRARQSTEATSPAEEDTTSSGEVETMERPQELEEQRILLELLEQLRRLELEAPRALHELAGSEPSRAHSQDGGQTT